DGKESQTLARPHPDLLPQEKEQRLRILESSNVSSVIAILWISFQSLGRFAEKRTMVLPLLGGEGRDEGECSSNFLPRLLRQNCSVLSASWNACNPAADEARVAT